MPTLLEYVRSLQDQGVPEEQWVEKVQEWKEKNNYETPEKIDTVVTGKTADVQDGATVTSEIPVAPENLSYGNGTFQYPEDDTIEQVQLEEVDIFADRRFSPKNVANALGVTVFADSSNPYQITEQQKRFSNFAKNKNATTVQDQINLGNVQTKSGGFKRGKNQSLFHDKSFFGKNIGALFNYRGVDVDDIQDFMQNSGDPQTVIGLNYEGGIKTDYGLLTENQIESKIIDLESKESTPENIKQIKHLQEVLYGFGGENFTSISVEDIQNAYLDERVQDVFSTMTDSSFTGYVNRLKNDGQYLLTPEEKDLQNVQLKLKYGIYENDEEKANLQAKVDAADEKFGDKLFDEKGDLIQFELSPSEIVEEAMEASDNTELDVLEKQYAETNQSLIELSKAALELNKTIDGVTYFAADKYGNVQDKNLLKDGDIVFLQQLIEKGSLPEKLTYISGNSTIADLINKKIQEYKVLNTAIQINRNPLAIEQKKYLEEAAKPIAKWFDLNIVTQNDQQSSFGTLLKNAGFVEGTKGWNDYNYIYETVDKNLGQNILAGVPHLMQFGAEIYYTRKLSGNTIARGFNALGGVVSKFFRGNKYMQTATRAVTKGFIEGSEFAAASLLKQTILDVEDDAPMSFGSGFSMGFGGVYGKSFFRALNKGFVRNVAATPLYYLNKSQVYRSFSKNAQSAAGGATAYVAGGILMDPLNFEYEKTLETFVTEWSKMYLLGKIQRGIMTPAGSLQNTYRKWSEDIAKMSNMSFNSKKGVKVLEVDDSIIKKPGVNSNREVNLAAVNKTIEVNEQLAQGKITEEEAKNKRKQIQEAKLALQNQIGVNQAKQQLKIERNAGQAPTKGQEYIVTNKLANGEKITAKDSKVISELPPEVIIEGIGAEVNTQTRQSVNDLINREARIQKMLNGGLDVIVTEAGFEYIKEGEYKALDPKLRDEAYDFLNKKYGIDNELSDLKKVDKSGLSTLQQEELQKEINQKEAELNEYKEGGAKYEELQNKLTEDASIRLEKDIAASKELAKTDVQGEVFDTAKTKEEFQQQYNQVIGDGKNVEEQIAFTDPNTGNRYINKPKALEVRNTNPGKHEDFHAITIDAFKDESGKVTDEGIRVIDGVISELSPRQREILKEELDSRYDTSKPKAEWYEENLTVLSELISDNIIRFKKSLGTKLLDMVPLYRDAGFENLKVDENSGQDLFKMLEGFAKGKKGAIKAASEFAKETKQKRLEEEVEKDISKLKTDTKKVDKKVPASLAKKDSETVNKIFAEKGKDGSFEILELLKPTAVALAKRFRNRPNYDEQLLVDEIMTGKRGMLDVINDYAAKVEKGEKVGELSLFLNNSFSTKTGFKRYIEIADRNLGKEFDQNVDDLAGLKEAPVAEVAKETPVEKIAKKPTETTKFEKTRLTPEFLESITVEEGQNQKDAIENKITEVVKESYKDRGPIKKYKDLGKTPRPLAKLYADMFGLKTVDAIIEKARNIPKFDNDALIKIRQFLVDNAASDFARLPKGKDAMGKATGILQTTIGKALYNKEGKLIGTLKNYIDIIKGKNVTINGVEFNKIVDGKKLPLYRDAQHYKAAIKAHIDNRALETLVKSPGERAKLGAKFSGAKKPLTVKQIEEAAKRKIGVDAKGNTLFRPNNIKQTRSEKYGIFGLTYENPRDKGKTYSTRDLEKPLPKELQATEGESVKDGIIRVTNEFLDSNPEYYNAIRDSVTAGVERGLLSTKEVFNTVVPAGKFKGIKQKGNRFGYLAKGGFLKPSFIKTFTGKDYIKSQEAQLDSFLDFFKGIEKYLTKNPQDAWYFDALVKDAQDNQNSIFRYSAPILFLNINKNGKYPLNVAMREEHSTPQNRIGTMLLDAAIKGNVNQISKLVKAIYMQGGLTRIDDALLDVNYKFGMPDFFWENVAPRIMSGELKLDNGLGAIIRMTEAGVNLDNYQYIVANKTFSEYFFGKKGLQQSVQAELIRDYFSGKKTAEQIKEYAKFEDKLSEPKIKEAEISNNLQPNNIKLKGESSKNSVEVVNELGNLDSALNTGRVAPFSTPKKIRVFDFDDTLAKSKSKVLYTTPNVEGGFSEGATKLKAIFMVGGPGAGKTNVGKGLQLGRRGYKVVNQDIALEVMKAESGLPAKESDYTAEQRSLRSKLGAAARKAAVEKFDKYAENGLGMVIDGTGASYNATTKKIKALEDKGYEVHMVVATTPLETAISRNKARVERSLPDFVVKKTYESVQESLKKYREDFGGRLYEINTETIEYGKPLPTEFLKQVYAGINTNKVGKVDATSFAENYDVLESQGAQFDFREFSRVIEGEKGPLFSVAQKIAKARGTEDIFILTARPADAAGPIQAFMKANGIDIPLQNITGLGDGTAAAKGRWIAGKAAEGYNDFYFADDAIKNVEAVKEVLSQVDVKSKVQQARFSKAKDFDRIFNDIIEAKTGIESYKQYSAAKAKTVGANKGRFGFFIPASAEDFTGLLYRTLGKGKVGDAQMAFYKENLLDPYNRAEMAISQAKVAAGRDYKELKKQFKGIPKTLEKETGISKFKYQHAIRTYIWDKQGLEVPGLSKRDQKRLVDFISNDAELSVFADNLITIQKGKPYPEPNKDWTAGTITTDVIGGINKINRAEYLKEWQENVDIIFSEKNINKLEAAFGPRYIEALKNSLAAMKSGSNRPLGGDRISNRILDWTNNSIGAVMFLNTRSAVLQTISSVNFINWGDNNLYAAGKAFGNQKQYWKDFLTLMNSDYLLERRDGLKINVSESEIADAVENSKNKATAAISYLLNKGFVFTRYADSFAIASGGATFYRNRIKSLMKEGMSQELAEQQAFEDFRLIAEENQQSSSPMRISQQQRSTIGRMVLAFGNTQMQYARIQKRAIQDLANGRGDWKSNISKIVYYGGIQNLMFNGLQSALGWSLFDDDEDENAKEKRREQKLQRTLNGMIDSQLKGLGIAGAVTSGVKNALRTIAKQQGKKSPKFEEAINDLENVIPAIGSKVRKLRSAARTTSWNRKEIKAKGFSLDNPAYLAGAQVISGVTNIPVDEAAMKINTMRNILNPYTEAWQKVALALGWSTWDVDLPYWGLAEEKPVLTKTEKQVKKLFDLNKSDQIKMLLDLGLTKKQIRALTKEQQRVDEIIKLQNKKKDGK